jgi:two-component system, NarL family, nitrate/nitrite response regulator NarL
MTKRILLVDDHPLVRETVRQILDGHYNICGEAANGVEAVQKAADLKPDLVIMDVSMPVMNGIAATRLIRENAPGTKILGLSMYSSAEVEREMKAAGADGMLAKTSKPKEIVRTIEDLFADAPTTQAN